MNLIFFGVLIIKELEAPFMDDLEMNPFECTLHELGFQAFSDEKATHPTQI